MTICLKCKTEFDPPGGLPSRRVCAKCIANRPGHLRDKTDNAGSTAAAVKRMAAVKVRKPADRFSFVSVADDPALMALLKAGRRQFEAEAWRQRNVIPFPTNRVKPPTRPIAPFFGGDAA